MSEHIEVPVIAETFAESPHTELFPPGSVRRFRRTANVGTTVVHRVFLPMWISLGCFYNPVPWSAEVRDYR